MWTAKILIKLGGCPGWPESSLGAQVILLVLSYSGSIAYFFTSNNLVLAWHIHCFLITAFSVLQNSNTQFLNCLVKRKQNFLYHWYNWAASWQIQQNDCAHSEDSDQPGHMPSLISFRCALSGYLRTQAFYMHTTKTLIRCPGWSESSLGAHAILLVLSRGGSYAMTRWDWWLCMMCPKSELCSNCPDAKFPWAFISCLSIWQAPFSNEPG